MTNECEHGRLARRCEICELIRVEDENSLRAQLKAANETIAELRDAFAETSSEAENRLRAKVAELEAERDRLREAIQNQCANLCTEAWTSRGMHHPDCLAHELEGGEDDS